MAEIRLRVQNELDFDNDSCFQCEFASKAYCWAKCPFLDIEPREDTKPIPQSCPLREKNRNKLYTLNKSVYDIDERKQMWK